MKHFPGSSLPPQRPSSSVTPRATPPGVTVSATQSPSPPRVTFSASQTPPPTTTTTKGTTTRPPLENGGGSCGSCVKLTEKPIDQGVQNPVFGQQPILPGGARPTTTQYPRVEQRPPSTTAFPAQRPSTQAPGVYQSPILTTTYAPFTGIQGSGVPPQGQKPQTGGPIVSTNTGIQNPQPEVQRPQTGGPIVSTNTGIKNPQSVGQKPSVSGGGNVQTTITGNTQPQFPTASGGRPPQPPLVQPVENEKRPPQPQQVPGVQNEKRPPSGTLKGQTPATGGQGLNRPTVPKDETSINTGPLYFFNYTAGFHGHHETGYNDGAKDGGYFVNDRDGVGRRVEYEANEFGYQPKITLVKLNPQETPREDTEKDFGLKGYEFIWFRDNSTKSSVS